MTHSEVQKALSRWRKQGWLVHRTGGGHYRLTHAATTQSIYMASTPSCRHALLNTETRLRRELREAHAARAVKGV